MGIYLRIPGDKMTWLAMHATPADAIPLHNLNMLWTTQATEELLAYMPVSADPGGSIALVFSRDEYKRLNGNAPGLRWFTAPKAEVNKVR